MKSSMFHTSPAWIFAASFAGFASMFTLHCFGQVVQLPVIHTFSYSGTVSVPDAGIAHLGGNRSSNLGGSTRGWGPYAGRAAGGSAVGGHTSLSAMIIDLKAMDDAILGQTAPPSAIRAGKATGPNLMSPQPYGYAKTSKPVPDPNAWQLALTDDRAILSSSSDSEAERDIRYFLEKAEESLRANRLAAARVFRRMAVERMTPELRDRMEQRAKEIQAATSGMPAELKPAEIAVPAIDGSKARAAQSSVNKQQF